MILVIGGMASGKKGYIKKVLGYREEQIANGILDSRPVLYGLEKLVAANAGQAEGFLYRLLEKEAIACNEVGCGIVPLEKWERDFREETGRLLIELAEQAEAVIRMQCGIPLVIKGNRKWP